MNWNAQTELRNDYEGADINELRPGNIITVVQSHYWHGWSSYGYWSRTHLHIGDATVAIFTIKLKPCKQ